MQLISLKCVGVGCSVVSNSLQRHGLQPTGLLCPWNSPGKKTGVGSHSLLQGIFPIQRLNLGLLNCWRILYHLSHQGSPQFKISNLKSCHCFIAVLSSGDFNVVPACNARDPGLISGSGRSPGEGNGNPLEYSCLQNSMDRGAWQATVPGDFKTHIHCFIYCSCSLINMLSVFKVFKNSISFKNINFCFLKFLLL